MFVGFVIGYVVGFYGLAALIALFIFMDSRINKRDVLIKHLTNMFDISEKTAEDIVSQHS